jgi:hypothetical protein
MSEEIKHTLSNPTPGNPLAALAITYRAVTSLRPHKRNARTHSKRQIRQIADSVKAFGFNNPVLIDASGLIVAGHGRFEAAKLLGLTNVPAITLEGMTEEQRRAYAIADNRLAELAGWDKQMLRIELGELSVEFPELDLTITGFEKTELDLIVLGEDKNGSKPKREASSEVDPEHVVSRPGDIWQLGPHRLCCGEAGNDTDPLNRGKADIGGGLKFIDETVRRFERLAGIKARHEVSGLTFAEETQARVEDCYLAEKGQVAS